VAGACSACRRDGDRRSDAGGDTINERLLQDGIREHLAKIQGLRSYAFAAGGTHGPLHGAVPVGFPDLLVIVPESQRRTNPDRYSAWRAVGPLHVYFEIKTLRGKPTKGQPEMQEELREQGVRVEVIAADSIEDGVRQVERVLADEGVVLREWE